MFSNSANNSFSESDLRRVLATPEGQRLLALLQKDKNALRQAMDAVKTGDHDSAKTALEPMLRSAEAKDLLEKLKAE
jgi:hypothetical protein